MSDFFNARVTVHISIYKNTVQLRFWFQELLLADQVQICTGTYLQIAPAALGPAGAMAMSKWLRLVDLHKNRRITTRVIIETIGKKTSGSIKSNIWFCF